MKRTKANMIRLLEALDNNAWEMKKMWEAEGKEEFANHSFGESSAYKFCADLLKNSDTFNEMCETFGIH